MWHRSARYLFFFFLEFILMWKYTFRASLRSWHHWLLELRLIRRENSFCSQETWLSCHPWSCRTVSNAGMSGDASGRPHQSCPFTSGVTENMIYYFPIPTVSKVRVIVMVLRQKGWEEMARVSLVYTGQNTHATLGNLSPCDCWPWPSTNP